MIVYITFPNRQDLRPALDTLGRENILTWCVGFLYNFDTNTGVFPSLHCAYSIGIMSVWLKAKGVWKWWKIFVVVAVILMCLSTMFIKQHSALDFFGALPVCLIAEAFLYGKSYWLPRLSGKKQA